MSNQSNIEDYEIEKLELETVRLTYEPRYNLTAHEQRNLSIIDDRLMIVNELLNCSDRYE